MILDEFLARRSLRRGFGARLLPVGLDILAKSDNEIALSIMAQYVERRGAQSMANSESVQCPPPRRSRRADSAV